MLQNINVVGSFVLCEWLGCGYWGCWGPFSLCSHWGNATNRNKAAYRVLHKQLMKKNLAQTPVFGQQCNKKNLISCNQKTLKPPSSSQSLTFASKTKYSDVFEFRHIWCSIYFKLVYLFICCLIPSPRVPCWCITMIGCANECGCRHLPWMCLS